jgi:hypothetical protein
MLDERYSRDEAVAAGFERPFVDRVMSMVQRSNTNAPCPSSPKSAIAPSPTTSAICATGEPEQLSMVNGQWLMVRRIARLFAAALLLLLLVQQVGAEPAWWGKIDPFLLAEMQAEPAADGGASVEFLVQMAVQADVSAAAQIDDKTAKGAFVYQQLTAIAQQTQPPF